jgi:hypothetical protein
MRLVHLSDLHLGIRQFQRQTPSGMNQREADVAGVFRRTLDRIVELAPDVIVIAGDVFHNVRPPNPSILDTFGQLARLRRALPDTIVVMVAGNHDTPRAVETGCILRLFVPLGIRVVDAAPDRLQFPERQLSILAVPDIAGVNIAWEPDPAMRYNVLVAHGDMPGTLPDAFGYSEPAALQLAPEEIGFARWSYVALGHHHVFHQLAPNACYSGSMEYTSANIWGELREQEDAKLGGKYFVEYDLDSRKRTLHKIEQARVVRDLPWIDARGMTAADVDAAIAATVKGVKGGIDDKIVRLVVRDIPRHVARELDHKALREYRRRAVYFHLDTRRPEATRALPVTGKGGRRPSLVELVQERLLSRPLTPDIDRQALVDLGLQYLQDAEAREAVGAIPTGDEGGGP